MAERPVPRPFLKWAGGKAQLVDELMARLPPALGAYHEPFLGGGALFFRLARDSRIRRATLSDLNAELVDTYLAVRDGVDEVIDELGWYPHSREFYYELRAQDPSCLTRAVRAARMIYLNKTGYNGLYRVNHQGQFNVPFGRYKAPNYLDTSNLRAVSVALQAVQVVCAPFATVLDRAQPGDLVYFDPPYVPLSSTARFTAYQAGGFSLDDQRHLRDVCLELTRRGVSVLVSNSDTALVRDLYTGPPFAIAQVRANRAINSAGNRRGRLTELIVTNYPVAQPAQLPPMGM